MARRVLILNGPTLTLEAVLGRSHDALTAELVSRGAALGLEVECVQANGEAALLDALLERREGLEAVVINPASLSPIAHGLADAVEALALPCIEVQLKHDAKSRGRSALKRVVDKQFHGHGVDGYFKALEALAKGPKAAEAPSTKAATEAAEVERPAPPRGKSIGKARPAAPSPEQPKGKTIGRHKPSAAASPSERSAPSTPTGAITRAQVRAQIAARLGKTTTPEAFAQWARGQWAAIQRGAAVEPGQKEKLEDLLLLLSTSAKASDHVIVTYAAKLES